MTQRGVPELLVEFRADLLAYVRRHSGRLLAWESDEDLVQGIHLKALESADGFEWRAREPALAWLHKVARSHIADRHSYWSAMRRHPARLVRLGRSAGATDAGDPVPPSTATGPSTFASRREELAIAVRALAVLLPRDRDLVRWTCDGVGTAEQAARIGISEESADRARRRALERYRKAFELASGV